MSALADPWGREVFRPVAMVLVRVVCVGVAVASSVWSIEAVSVAPVVGVGV